MRRSSPREYKKQGNGLLRLALPQQMCPQAKPTPRTKISSSRYSDSKLIALLISYLAFLVWQSRETYSQLYSPRCIAGEINFIPEREVAPAALPPWWEGYLAGEETGQG